MACSQLERTLTVRCTWKTSLYTFLMRCSRHKVGWGSGTQACRHQLLYLVLMHLGQASLVFGKGSPCWPLETLQLSCLGFLLATLLLTGSLAHFTYFQTISFLQPEALMAGSTSDLERENGSGGSWKICSRSPVGPPTL